MARFGSDRTVICARQGDRVIEMESFTKKDTMETAGLVNQFVKRHSPSCVRVDVIGVGAGVVDRLKELGVPGVTGINVARRATNQEHFANLKAELYDGLRERFQQGRIPDSRQREADQRVGIHQVLVFQQRADQDRGQGRPAQPGQA